MAALERSRRDLFVDAPLGVCNLPVVQSGGNQLAISSELLRGMRYNCSMLRATGYFIPGILLVRYGMTAA